MTARATRVAAVALASLIAACGSGTGPTGAPTTAGAPTSAFATGTPATLPPTAAPTQRPDYVVVAVGDSIPFNAPQDCPGCTGFVDQYAAALAEATGKTVGVQNRSKHTGLQVDGLLADLDRNIGLGVALADADVIIVGIAHNDVPMNRNDDSCDGTNNETPDWTRYTDACIATEVERFTPLYEQVYSSIAVARFGKPTILLTINRYNDWIGWPDFPPPPAGEEATARVIRAWNEMLCSAAEENGFTCVDVSTAFNGQDGRKPSGDLVAADYTHPSQKGNDVIAGLLVAEGFEPLVP